jgi:hypothetical protein
VRAVVEMNASEMANYASRMVLKRCAAKESKIKLAVHRNLGTKSTASRTFRRRITRLVYQNIPYWHPKGTCSVRTIVSTCSSTLRLTKITNFKPQFGLDPFV